MTEDEAKTKWCPFGRILAGTDGTPPLAASYNRSSELDEPRCIASACMAWRPSETPEFKRVADDVFRRTGERLTSPGYCGLAGAPA